MSKLIAFLFLPFIFSCIADNNETTNIQQASPMFLAESETTNEPYEIDLSIEKLDNSKYNLTAAIDLETGAYFFSPYSQTDFLGCFKMIIENNDNLIMADTLLEIPRSVEEIDRWNHRVNCVRENTIYKQNFKIDNKDKFEIEGLVQFVIEPKCTMEKIRFTISNNSGKVEVKRLMN